MSDTVTISQTKALLKIGYLCNYRCSFCHAETKKQIKDIAIKALYLKILLLKKKWVHTILLSGGESTLEKHFFQIVDFITKHWLSFGIVTNGSTIYQKDFLARLNGLGIKNIYLSIHGHKEVHNDLVGDPNSFEKVMSIIADLRDNYPHIKLFLNYVVVKQNVESIGDTVSALKELEYPWLPIKFSFLEPEWAGDNKDLMISPRYAAEKIRSVIQNNSSPYLKTYWDGFPLCHFADMLDKRADLQTESIFHITEIYEHRIFSTDYGKRSYATSCDTACSLRAKCYGIFSKYYENFDEKELLTPIA